MRFMGFWLLAGFFFHSGLLCLSTHPSLTHTEAGGWRQEDQSTHAYQHTWNGAAELRLHLCLYWFLVKNTWHKKEWGIFVQSIIIVADRSFFFIFFCCYADHFCSVIKLVCLLYKTSFLTSSPCLCFDLYFCSLHKQVRCIKNKNKAVYFFLQINQG